MYFICIFVRHSKYRQDQKCNLTPNPKSLSYSYDFTVIATTLFYFGSYQNEICEVFISFANININFAHEYIPSFNLSTSLASMADTCKAFTRLSTGIDLNVWPSALWHFGSLAAPLNHKYWPHWCNAACLLCVSHICHDLIFTRFSIGSHQVFSESQYWLRVFKSFIKFSKVCNYQESLLTSVILYCPSFTLQYC